MTRARIPDDILSAAHERSSARAAGDWAEADRLRGVIEAAGWKVVDRGTDFALTPATPPDVHDADRVRYGSSASVPSRLDEPSVGIATVILVATDRPADLARALVGLRTHAPAGTSIVVVADGPTAGQEAALADPSVTDPDVPVEVVSTSEPLGLAAAINIGIRRATGPIVIALDTSAEPTGDIVTPLARALDDATVAIAGGWGAVSSDFRTFTDAPSGDADVINGYVQAFRRADVATYGLLDERFRTEAYLDVWWSLVLRDTGEGSEPRRAVAVADLPLTIHDRTGPSSLDSGERDRQRKRNFYRVLERFGDRRDLLTIG